jgi:hypothetical protein
MIVIIMLTTAINAKCESFSVESLRCVYMSMLLIPLLPIHRRARRSVNQI